MRPTLLVAAFVAVLGAVLVGGHLYLVRRLVLDPGLPPVLAVGIFLLGATLVLEPLGQRVLPRRTARLLAWPASLWMGFAFLLLVFFVSTDVLIVLSGAVADSPADPTRLARVRALAAVALALGGGVVGVRAALRAPVLRRLEVRLARWPAALDGFRVVQVSDLHIGPILDRRFAEHVTARVNALAPDLIAITGDLVDGSVARLADEVAPFARLRAPHGVYCVTGNHDYYSGADPWMARVRELGIRVLRNERVLVGDGAGGFELAGVEDHHAHLVSRTHREDLPKALAGRDPARPLVLLAHDPATFPRAAAMGVDLQLSGHTHGGQVWPFRHLVRLSTPYVAGHFRRGDAQLYVSRGTGFWGPAMRLLAPAEITEIVLRAA